MVDMANNKNSISLLITYFCLIFIELTTQKSLSFSKIVYKIITIENIMGAFLLIFVNKKLKYKNLIEKKYNTNYKNLILNGLIGILIILAMQYITSNMSYYIFHIHKASQNTDQLLTVFKNNFYYGIDIAISSPIIEEIIFRKVLFGNLISQVNIWISGFTSSCLFAILHQDGHFLTYFVMGCILEFIYYKSHNVCSSIITHSGMNIFILVISLLSNLHL